MSLFSNIIIKDNMIILVDSCMTVHGSIGSFRQCIRHIREIKNSISDISFGQCLKFGVFRPVSSLMRCLYLFWLKIFFCV